ncbi:hypothetical protein PG993_003759 [Apiospora rasikravindrae]|uniref:Uncharacterized protein n=1 Tax=Apiospora rasikravindrae TaxID=990691 RepID=A0ABR1U0G2_9PEZI
MEYQPTSTPSYPPQPLRPVPGPVVAAPALYAPAPGAAGIGSASAYYTAATAPGGRYSEPNIVQQLPPRISSGDRSIKSARTTCEFAAREYLTQLRKIPSSSSYSVSDPKAVDAMARARAQQGLVLDELQTLRRSLAVVIKEAEAHRWRKWVLGGMLASIIPLVRRIFRRPSKDNNAKGEATDTATKTKTTTAGQAGSNALMNATEYAFGKSRALITRIRESVRGSGWFLGGFAAVSFFVLSVLYVFENEVSLRVAKTVSKRLKRLAAKVERGGGGSAGEANFEEKDLAVLQQGWRWRVLTWSG